jgi:hypothetical protein
MKTTSLLGPASLLLVLAVGCGGAPSREASAPEAPAGVAHPAQPGGGAAAAPEARIDAPMDDAARDASAAAAPPAEPVETSGEEAEAPMAPAPPPPPAAARPTGAATAPRPSPSRATKGAAGEARGGAAFVLAPRGIRAGEWDDNANYQDFLAYIGQQGHLGIDRVDVTSRRFLVVRDAAGKGVPGCLVRVRDEAQREARLTTTASGRAILFPRAMGLSSGALVATTACQGARAAARFDTARADEAVVLDLPRSRASVASPIVDVAFVLDTTGSMSEEIREVKETLRRVTDTLAARGVRVRIGLVEYKDKGDELVTRTYPMTADVAGFARTIAHIHASGGGDMPENANEGLEVALRDLAWSEGSAARLAFLIADAPPHLDYQDADPYSESARRAAERGIQIFTVATSGMDALGQAVFRQIAQLTGGTNMFVLRGGAGPQSTGAGDARSSCGGTHENFASGNLDALITRKIAQEIAALDADPMRIAGLGQDERAKPCGSRVLVLAD